MQAVAAPAVHFSRRYVGYALGLIFAVAVINVCDRTIMAVLVVDIRRELDLDDRQMGWLMGPAFATVHILAGLPLARLADRGSRRAIISIGLLAWSAMTALCGLAQGFGQLLAARMGVGIGEAAGAPPSHSLISDYLSPERRARGLSLLPIGSTLGIGLGMVAGGWINQIWGWRAAFLAVGLPGMALAAVVWLTLREPPRGHSEGRTSEISSDSALDVIQYLFRTPSYVWMVLGMSAAGIYLAGARYSWEPTFLRETYGLGPAAAGTTYFLIAPVPTMLGAALGGALTDRLGQRDSRWYLAVPALCNVLAVPLLLAFLLWPESQRVGGVPIAFAFCVLASIILGGSSPGILALGQSLARPQMRAFSAALWSMAYTLISMGLGPLLVGDLSTRLRPTAGPDALRFALAASAVLPLVGAALQLAGTRSLRADLERARASGGGLLTERQQTDP
jgi:MFS family permease